MKVFPPPRVGPNYERKSRLFLLRFALVSRSLKEMGKEGKPGTEIGGSEEWENSYRKERYIEKKIQGKEGVK